MSEETTDNLSERNSFESRALAELAAINSRLSGVENRLTALEGKVDGLEGKVDARLRETRPIWEAVLARVEVIDTKLDILNRDLLETRAETELLKKRLPPAA